MSFLAEGREPSGVMHARYAEGVAQHSQGSRSAGLSYTMQVAPRDLSAETLRKDVAATVDPGSPLLAISSSHEQELRAVVDTVVGDATTPYDQAIALLERRQLVKVTCAARCPSDR